jgi:hypothetical protein
MDESGFNLTTTQATRGRSKKGTPASTAVRYVKGENHSLLLSLHMALPGVAETKVRPSNVQVSVLTTDTRTVYVNPDWVGSQITFGTACPADGASVTGFAATAAITQAFSTSGVIKICVQSSKDLTAATSRRWIELNDFLTVNTGSLTTALPSPGFTPRCPSSSTLCGSPTSPRPRTPSTRSSTRPHRPRRAPLTPLPASPATMSP